MTTNDISFSIYPSIHPSPCFPQLQCLHLLFANNSNAGDVCVFQYEYIAQGEEQHLSNKNTGNTTALNDDIALDTKMDNLGNFLI